MLASADENDAAKEPMQWIEAVDNRAGSVTCAPLVLPFAYASAEKSEMLPR